MTTTAAVIASPMLGRRIRRSGAAVPAVVQLADQGDRLLNRLLAQGRR